MSNKRFIRNYATIFTLIALIFTLPPVLTGCAKKMHFERSSVVPSAEGTVKWKKDKNENYSISINLLRLAEPDRLHPPKNMYVAWMQTRNDGVKNLGQLKTSTGLFSKALKASLQTVTPFEPVSVFITAEQEATMSYPGNQVVLVARN